MSMSFNLQVFRVWPVCFLAGRLVIISPDLSASLTDSALDKQIYKPTTPHTHTLWHECVTSYIRDGVEGRVCPDTQVWAGDIVGHSGRDHHHGNTKLCVLGTSCLQLHQPQICLRSEQGLTGHWLELWVILRRGRAESHAHFDYDGRKILEVFM